MECVLGNLYANRGSPWGLWPSLVDKQAVSQHLTLLGGGELALRGNQNYFEGCLSLLLHLGFATCKDNHSHPSLDI